MAYRIEVTTRDHLPDPRGRALVQNALEELGIRVESARVVDVYTIDLDLSREDLQRVQLELLTDPIAEKSSITRPLLEDWDYWIEVGFRPGVTDNVGKTASEGVRDLLNLDPGAGRTVFVSTGYALKGRDLSPEQVREIAHGMLANDLIEETRIVPRDRYPGESGFPVRIPKVHLPETPDVRTYNLEISDEALEKLSQENTWALTLEEMRTIRDRYRDSTVRERREKLGLPKNPTDVELEVLAQTWSEHCKHKIFASNCTYREGEAAARRIENLFKTTIKKTTETLAGKKDWLVSVFHDNAGAIRFTEDYHLTIKVETHNSPSALDPYGGALTGIVGVNRDPLGTGLGCRLIFNTDVFCFGLPHEERELPPPLLHPRRILRGVHRGVMDGANTSGIPDVNGAILFDRRFTGKPLVFCGTGGLLPVRVGDRPGEIKEVRPGDRIVMVGGRIGKDGIHGATFSSEVLHEDSPATAVQIGDPITQRKLMDFLLEARDLGLYRSITDNGAGGLSSSVGEMATLSGGAEIHLERAPLKYDGLAPWEIFLSEAQERMTLVVPPENLEEFLALARRRSTEATDLGEFTDTGFLTIYHQGKVVGDLNLDFLHNGWPVMELPARWNPPQTHPPRIPDDDPLGERLKSMLSRLNICSKEPFVRMYDHEVQGGSTLKPFQGVDGEGPGDAAVVRPLLDSPAGVAVACGIVPRYSDLDAKAMAENAVDEALRNLLAVGAPLDEVAALDNFCWPDPVPSPTNPDAELKMAQLVRACEGLQRICLAYEMPLVSGKDSMKNDSRIGDEKISIPPTLLVTAVAVMPDVSKAITMDFKEPGDLIYLLGTTRAELGCSEYLAEFGQIGDRVPTVRPEEAWPLYQALARATSERLVKSCHDLSDGGFGVALAESAFAGGLGAEVDLAHIPVAEEIDRDEVLLFSESPSRFIVTVSPKLQTEFELLFEGVPSATIGRVTHEDSVRIQGLDGNRIVEEKISVLKEAWQRPFKNY